MKEENFSLPTSDNKKIYSIISYAEGKASRAVILAHGVTGSMYEHLHLKARDVFLEAGYDVIRFNFYSAEDDARKLETSTLEVHAIDLNNICDHFGKNYEKTFVCGHSYGGLSLLMANPKKATALAFWDASYQPYVSFWRTDAKPLDGTPYFIMGWGSQNLIGKNMLEEAKNLTREKANNFASKIKVPSLVALAESSIEDNPRTILFDSLSCEKKLIEIKGADHIFCAGNTALTLAHATRDFFNQY